MMKKYLRKEILIATLAICVVGQPFSVQAQSLPWQSSQSSQSQDSPSQSSQGTVQHHHKHKAQQQADAPPSKRSHANTGRQADDHELGRLAMKFYGIHAASDPKAIEKLGALEQQVRRFRKTLSDKDGESDIQHDTEGLEYRISRQRKQLEAAAAAQSTPSPAPTPAASLLPAASPAPSTPTAPVVLPPVSPATPAVPVTTPQAR